MSEPAIRKALTTEEIFLKQDKERYLYEMREKALLDHVSAIAQGKEDIKAGKIHSLDEVKRQLGDL